MTTYLIKKEQINFDESSIVIKHNGEEIKIRLADDVGFVDLDAPTVNHLANFDREALKKSLEELENN